MGTAAKVTAFSLLFDLDGTLCDTDQFHYRAYLKLLAELGRTLTLAEYQAKIMGQPNPAIMREIFPDLPEAQQLDIMERKEALFRDSVKDLEPARGLLLLLDWAEARGVGIAVVTNAPRANAEMMLNGLGLARRLPTLVIGDELERAKPDPLPYLTALARLGGSADHALAFEDSLPGIRAAAGAGVATYGIRTGHGDAALLQAGACAAIDDFTDSGLWRRLEAMTA